MQLTPEQVKGRIKNVAKENKADARTLMRIYMMERFLERVANSQYKDNFIIKGGMLVTAMVGVALRSTMDIDTSIKNQNLSAEDARRIVDEIKDIDLGDGVTFEVKEVSNIMDEMEYPGIRFTMNAVMGKLVTPMKIDISTGDVITPRAIEYNYKLLLDDRSISLWSYNLETILAEKLQTVLARGLLNTRMRDFYDIKTLLSIYEQDIDADVLKKAFEATCKKRSTENLKEEAPKIMAAVSDDAQLHTLWMNPLEQHPRACFLDPEYDFINNIGNNEDIQNIGNAEGWSCEFCDSEVVENVFENFHRSHPVYACFLCHEMVRCTSFGTSIWAQKPNIFHYSINYDKVT